MVGQSAEVGFQAPGASNRAVRTPSPRMMDTGGIKKNKIMEWDGQLWKVLEFLSVKQARQAGMVKTKLKNVLTGTTLEKTFKSGQQFPDPQLDAEQLVMSYIDADEHVFMDANTYEEVRLKTDVIGPRAKYIGDGVQIEVVFWKGTPIDVKIPEILSLEIIEEITPVKAKLEGNIVQKMPGGFKVGDVIQIDTEKGEYLGRVGSSDYRGR